MYTIDKAKFINDIKRDLGYTSEKIYINENNSDAKEFGNFESLGKTLNEIFKIKKEEEKIMTNPNNIYVTCKIKKSEENKGYEYEKNIKIKRIIENNKTEKEKIHLKIPKYIKNNQLIIFKGKGNRNNRCIGNLIIKINLK